VSYEVNHNFADKNTNVKLTAASQGTTFGAEYDQTDGVKEVTANRSQTPPRSRPATSAAAVPSTTSRPRGTRPSSLATSTPT